MTSAGQRLPGNVLARLLLGVLAAATCLMAYVAPAQALPAPQTAGCAGIWVVVDYGSLGGTSTKCAAGYSTGMAALRAVPEFAPTLDAGMVVKINGLPTVPNVQDSYWSYWHATRQADGSYSSWSYSSLGPSAYHPTATDAEGWRYETVAGGYVAPRAVPPKLTATSQAPATTAAAATTKAATTRAATTAPVAQSTTQAPAPTTTDPTTAPATSMSAESSPPVLSDGESTPVTIAPPARPATTAPSSLVGGIGAIAAIAVGAGGVLIWRKRGTAKG